MLVDKNQRRLALVLRNVELSTPSGLLLFSISHSPYRLPLKAWEEARGLAVAMGAPCSVVAEAVAAAYPSVAVASDPPSTSEEELPSAHPQAHWVCGTCGAFLHTRKVICWRTCPVCSAKAGTPFSEDVQTWPMTQTRSVNIARPRTL